MKEPQYQALLDVKEKHGVAKLGLMTNQAWHDDPIRFSFTAARYKFVAKMLAGRDNVLEVGCADAFFTRIVQQFVGQVSVVDIDTVFLDDVVNREEQEWRLRWIGEHNMFNGPVEIDGGFDAVYALDVLEHIRLQDEQSFLRNIMISLGQNGVVIIGMPSFESQKYASAQSKRGHVNCKSGEELRATMQEYFHTVFMFSMNDEVVHTGFFPMSHYLFAVCADRK